MEYAKPKLWAFSSIEAVAACHDGAAANSSGCTNGDSVGVACASGSGVTAGGACADGTNPGSAGSSWCVLGVGATTTTYPSRCIAGTLPS